MPKSTVNDAQRRRYIANMTAVNAALSLIIGMVFFVPSMLSAGTHIPITIHPNPTIYIPSWLFIIQIVDYFLLLSLWRDFYKMDKHSAGYRIINWHIAMMTIIIVGLNQVMPFIALGNHDALYNFIGNANMAAAGYGFLFWAMFNNRKTSKYLFGGQKNGQV
ncbi:hypothetical protein [Acidithiobacillus sp.]|uniref:hypothetical protein n=1 Tax=Acidithiobacillus sp. TaxID=1872118 RepID=UPI0025C1810F|nr:hypothetical protein [Acidithiobacillus sp.]